MMIFTKKMYHRPFDSDKNISNSPFGLKIYQHTQFEKGFQFAMKLENW